MEDVRISKSKNLSLTANIENFQGELYPQSPPYPLLKITHNTTSSGITFEVIDFEGIAPLEVGAGIYRWDLSSTIFGGANIVQYKANIKADIAEDIYFTNLNIIQDESKYVTSYSFTIKQDQNFYRQQLKNFISETFREHYNESPQFRTYLDSIGAYFDKIDQIAENIITLTRIDEVPDEYLRYLGQVVGYETDDFTISNLALRSIISEIFAVYNARGTVEGFDKFLRSLGYDLTLEEKWYEGPYRIVNEKPHYADFSDTTEAWKYSHLRGIESTYSGTAITPAPFPSGIYGKLDLIYGKDGEYRFVELYPSSLLSYSFSSEKKFREPSKFSKAERFTNFIESIKGTEFVPDIINQINKYIAFLKPVHLKLVTSLINSFDNDYWWQTGDIEPLYNDAGASIIGSVIVDGSTVLQGNIPRDIDDINQSYFIGSKLIYVEGFQVNPGFVDVGSGFDGISLSMSQVRATPYTIDLYFDGKFNLDKTNRYEYLADGKRYWPYGDDCAIDYMFVGNTSMIGSKLVATNGKSVDFNFTNYSSSIYNYGTENWGDNPSLIGTQGVDYLLNTNGLQILSIYGGPKIDNLPNKRFFKEIRDNTYIFSFKNNNSFTNQNLFSEGNTIDGFNIAFVNQSLPYHKMKINIYSDTIGSFIASSIYTHDNNIHACAISFKEEINSTLTTKVYFDGSYVASKILTVSAINAHTDEPLIGRYMSPYNQFDGSIYRTLIFEKAYNNTTIEHILDRLTNNLPIDDFLT
jgi:hypothetical protein